MVAYCLGELLVMLHTLRPPLLSVSKCEFHFKLLLKCSSATAYNMAVKNALIQEEILRQPGYQFTRNVVRGL